MKLSTKAIVLLLASAAGASNAQEQTEQLGAVHFETSCTETGQVAFETGLLLLHHMMYRQSAKVFEESTAA